MTISAIFHWVLVGVICAGAAADLCPPRCECFNLQRNELKIQCQWPAIPGPEIFAVFQPERTHTLTIRCTDPLASSKLTPGLFRSLPQLRHLYLDRCQSNPNVLPMGMFEGLGKLKTLHFESLIERSGHLKIESGAFKGLESLDKLELAENGIAFLPEAEFCRLKELKWLNVSHNRLSNLNNTGFVGCPTQLVVLDLGFNQIKSIEPKVFGNFKHLHLLDLSHNQISTVTFGSLEGLVSLRKLALSGNEISDFSENLYSVASQIKMIDLSDNRISSIRESLLRSKELVRLNLSNNYLASLEKISFVMPSLKLLDLSNNRVEKVPSSVFDNATSLTSIYLASNRLSSLDAFAFRNLKSLAFIDLSNNLLTKLQHDSFYQLENLDQLILANNSVSGVPENLFAGMPKITRLDLSKNNFIHVPTAITVLYYLSDLNLANNKINISHKFLFDRLPNLNRLNLAKNLMERVDRYIFENVPKLEQLDLSENRLQSLSANCFDKTENLKILYLQGNEITGIQGVLSNLKALWLLNVSQNHIQHIDLSMLPSNLTTLIASKNSILRLTNFLSRTINFRQVDFSWNNLTTLTTDTLPPSLEIGNFSFNKLQQVGEFAFSNLNNLKFIDLRWNNLSELNRSSVTLRKAFAVPPTIYLSKNPLKCSCYVDWLKVLQSGSFGSTNLPLIADYDDLLCTDVFSKLPDPLPVSRVPKDQFLCPYDLVCSDECPCCDFDSCDCKNACPTGCQCYRDSAFIENIVKCSRSVEKMSVLKIPAYATQIHLDGVDLSTLKRHDFLGRHRLRHLYLNGSKIQSIEEKAFVGLTSLEYLDLSHNNLTHITGMELNNVPKLRHLDLSHNKIAAIGEQFIAQQIPPTLRLNNNEMIYLPKFITASKSILSVTLSENPWKCDCGDKFRIQTWLPQHTAVVPDYRSIYCFQNLSETTNQTVLAMLPPTDHDSVKVNFWTFRSEINSTFCPEPRAFIPSPTEISENYQNSGDYFPEKAKFDFNNYIMFAVVGGVAVLGIIIATISLWRLRRFVKYRVARKKLPPTLPSLNTDSSPTSGSTCPFLQYDAFVAYSGSDEGFVHKEFAVRLEQEVPYYELCLLHRDSAVPYDNRHSVDDTMISLMEQSQRILLILTENFLSVEWKLLQIRTALQCAMKEKRSSRKLIVILKDLKDLHNIDSSLGHLMRTNVCIAWSDPMFWEKLREAMPDKIMNSPLNSTTSTDLYGTIVPSEFV